MSAFASGRACHPRGLHPPLPKPPAVRCASGPVRSALPPPSARSAVLYWKCGAPLTTGLCRQAYVPVGGQSMAVGFPRAHPNIRRERRGQGGGSLGPKVCVPGMARSDVPDCKFRFSPR